LMNFRIVKHVHELSPNKVIKHFEKYLDAVDYLVTIRKGAKLHWIEGKINGEWFGLA